VSQRMVIKIAKDHDIPLFHFFSQPLDHIMKEHATGCHTHRLELQLSSLYRLRCPVRSDKVCLIIDPHREDEWMEISASANIGKLKLGVFNELLERKRELTANGKSMIDLSVGSPDLPPPAFVKEEIQKHAAEDGNYGYTMGGLSSFNRAVADFYQDRYGVELDPATEVLQLIGSQDGLAHLATAIIDPGDVVLVP